MISGISTTSFQQTNPVPNSNNKRDLYTFEDKDIGAYVYKIAKQLKKNVSYNIHMEVEYPPCMSDLKEGKQEDDSFECNFVECTTVFEAKFMFPFNLKEYIIHIRRKDMSEFKYEPIKPILLDKNGKEINMGKKETDFNYFGFKIEQENLRNDDKIIIYYKLKKRN